MPSRSGLVIMLTGFALVGLAVGLAFFNFPTMPSSSGDSGPAIPGLTEFVGSEAPGFDLRTLDGDALQLTDLRGRVVLLNFWATWCGPCRVEMPDLQARADRWTDRLTIVGVNFDEPEADVRTFRDELGLTFPIVLDPGAKVQNLYRIVGYPTTIFIDSQGVVRVQHVGLMSPDQLDKYLAQMGLAG